MILLIVTVIAIVALELPGLVKEKNINSIIFFSFLLLVGSMISLVIILDLPLKSPGLVLIEGTQKYLPWFYQFMELN